MKIKTDKILRNTRELNDEEFRVLFHILNSINMFSNDFGECKIYRAELAELTGKSERTISRITKKLEDRGLIEVQRCTKQSNIYKYVKQEQKTSSFLVTDVTLIEHEKKRT